MPAKSRQRSHRNCSTTSASWPVSLSGGVGIEELKRRISGRLKNTCLTIGVEMMPRSRSYKEDLLKVLQDPEEAAIYLESAIEE